MSSNNRADSDDGPHKNMDMDTGRRDDRTDQGRRDDRADHGNREDRTDQGRHEDRTDQGRREDRTGHGNREARADHGNREDRADHGNRDDRTGHEANPRERGKWLSSLIALLGIWMIVMALVLDVTGTHFWSDVLAGALLVGVGGYNYSRQANERVANSALALIAVATGLWLIAAPYVLGADTGLTGSAYDLWFYSHIAVGLLAVGLGAYSAFAGRDHQQDTRRTKA